MKKTFHRVTLALAAAACPVAPAFAQADAADWAAFLPPRPEPERPLRPLGPAHDDLARGGPLMAPTDATLLPAAEHRLLTLLAEGRWADAAAWLKEADPDVQARDAQGHTPLTLAIQGGQPALVRELLRRGAPLEQPGTGGFAPAALAAYLGDDVILRALIRQGADVRAPGPAGQTALHLAALAGQTRCIAVLLQARPVQGWAESYNAAGRHALAEAAFHGRLVVVRQLAAAGWSLAAPDRHQLNALHAAALGEQWPTVDELLAHGVPLPSPTTQLLIDRRVP